LPARISAGHFGALVSGVMEISCGFSRLAACPAGAARYFCGGLILGFGGFAVLLQSADAAGECGLCAGKYLMGKAVQGLLCGAIAAAAGTLIDAAPAEDVFFLFGAGTGRVCATWQMMLLFLLVFAVCAVKLKIFAKIFKKLWKKSDM